MLLIDSLVPPAAGNQQCRAGEAQNPTKSSCSRTRRSKCLRAADSCQRAGSYRRWGYFCGLSFFMSHKSTMVAIKAKPMGRSPASHSAPAGIYGVLSANA